MKRFIVFMFILLLIATGFLYLGYQPQLGDIDFTGSLFGYNIQASQYTIYGTVIVLFVIISALIRFFVGIKNIYTGVIGFFTGRNKEKATENLLNAYAHLIGKKPKTAKNYFKKAEKYYKGSQHIALIRLAIEQSESIERPTSDALAKIENQKTLKPVGAYVESLFSISQKDDFRMIALFKESGSYAESIDVLYEYLAILVRTHDYSEAEIALKTARGILSDDAYKFHTATISLLKSHQAYTDKNPDNMLAFALEALKFYKNPIALSYAMQAYKTLQRDNKAVRLLHDYFSEMPSMCHTRIFLEFKNIEAPEETAKRIAALPRTHDTAEAFIALQAYHFAVAKDFISLNSVLSKHQSAVESLWEKAAKLCLIVEKDATFFVEALKLFKDALYAQSRQEILDMYAVNQAYIYDKTFIFNKFIPETTQGEVRAKVSLFKQMLKFMPILQKKNIIPDIGSVESPNLYHLEANIYKNKME